jgi:hypothetical protein
MTTERHRSDDTAAVASSRRSADLGVELVPLGSSNARSTGLLSAVPPVLAKVRGPCVAPKCPTLNPASLPSPLSRDRAFLG